MKRPELWQIADGQRKMLSEILHRVTREKHLATTWQPCAGKSLNQGALPAARYTNNSHKLSCRKSKGEMIKKKLLLERN